MRSRPIYTACLQQLQAAHDACFAHSGRGVLGMSHREFSGVNYVLGQVLLLEEDNQRLRQELVKAQSALNEVSAGATA
jgi:hypothetical protein